MDVCVFLLYPTSAECSSNHAAVLCWRCSTKVAGINKLAGTGRVVVVVVVEGVGSGVDCFCLDTPGGSAAASEEQEIGIKLNSILASTTHSLSLSLVGLKALQPPPGSSKQRV